MPVETIKCQECGSSDVQEVKPSTYFCNHCDAVCQHVDPTATPVAGCEIDSCGVAAVGRCHGCTRAFCGTHQGREDDAISVDLCSSCQAERVASAVATAEANLADRQAAHRRELHRISDPVERLVAAVPRLCWERLTGSEGSEKIEVFVRTDMLDVGNDVCPA
jgi:hypothetical protein